MLKDLVDGGAVSHDQIVNKEVDGQGLESSRLPFPRVFIDQWLAERPFSLYSLSLGRDTKSAAHSLAQLFIWTREEPPPQRLQAPDHPGQPVFSSRPPNASSRDGVQEDSALVVKAQRNGLAQIDPARAMIEEGVLPRDHDSRHHLRSHMIPPRLLSSWTITTGRSLQS